MLSSVEVDPTNTYSQLSLKPLVGHFSPQAHKFQGLFGGLPVTVLVDTSSIHNIFQPRIAQHLNLAATIIPQF